MYCVYRFKNEGDSVVYIGKTKNIDIRMKQHFGGAGHLNKEFYENIKTIEYIELPSKIDMDIKELYYINKYKPIYNRANKQDEPLILRIKETDEWKIFKDSKERENVRLSQEVIELKQQLSEKECAVKEKDERIFSLKEKLVTKEEEKRLWEVERVSLKNETSLEVNKESKEIELEKEFNLEEVKKMLKVEKNLIFTAKVVVNKEERYHFLVYYQNKNIMSKEMMTGEEVIIENEKGEIIFGNIQRIGFLLGLRFIPEVNSQESAENIYKTIYAEEERKIKISVNFNSVNWALQKLIYTYYSKEEIEKIKCYLWDNRNNGNINFLVNCWIEKNKSATKGLFEMD